MFLIIILNQGGKTMDKKLGFIGCGNMGGAILMGALKKEALNKENVAVVVKSEKSKTKYRELGITVFDTVKELCEWCDIAVLAVKPYMAKDVLSEGKAELKGKALVSVAAGLTNSMLLDMTDNEVRVLRTMPNTPALIGEGVMIMCEETDVTEEEKAFVEKVYEANGAIYWIPEKLMDSAGTVAGCTPAFVAMFIEALADGGVREGVPREMAYKLAANAVYGSAKMMLETGFSPSVMKDMVCSPGGTTIEGVAALEEGGMRHAVIDCIHRSTEKTKRLV